MTEDNTYDNYEDTPTEPIKLAVGNKLMSGDDVIFQANWNKYSQRKGLIQINIGGKEAVVDRDQLFAILFMLGSDEEKDKIVDPFIKKTQVEKFTKMVGIMPQNDVRKGEMLNVLLEFTYNPNDKQIIIGKGSESGLTSNQTNSG